MSNSIEFCNSFSRIIDKIDVFPNSATAGTYLIHITLEEIFGPNDVGQDKGWIVGKVKYRPPVLGGCR